MKNFFSTIRKYFFGSLIVCLTSFLSFAGNSQSNTIISLKASNCRLREIIKEIESETEYTFIYSANKIPLNENVTLQKSSASILQILDEALKPLGVSYRVNKKSIVLIPSYLSEQLTKEKGALSGSVKDTKGIPLAYSSVVVKELNRGVAADINGNFKFSEIPQGSYTLVISFLGYQTTNKEITINAKQTTSISVELSESQTKLSEAVVYGNITRGQASALTQQKNSKNIKNVVSSEQFSKFPDRNAAEVVARIPSVSVDYDQGEGQNVQIRGMSPDYNSLTINGERIPAPDPGGGSRGVGLDLLNQNLIESIEVVKAITPDIDGDAIGGSINFKMKEASDSLNLSVDVGGGYNPQHSEFETYGKDVMSFSLFAGDRFFDNKLGILVGGSYYKTNRGSMLAEYNYDDEDEDYDDEIYAQHTNDYDVKRQRYGFLFNADYKFDAFNKLYITANANYYDDDEIRRSVEYHIEDGEETRTTRNRGEYQTLFNVSFGGENRIKNAEIDYAATYIVAEEDMPNRTYWRYARDVDYSQYTNDEVKAFSANSVLESNDVLTLNRLRCDDYDKKDGDFSAKFNVKIPFFIGHTNSSFKFGAKYLKKNVEYNPFRTDYKKFADDHTIAGGQFGYIDIRYDDIDLDALEASSIKEVTSVQEKSYEASESVFASYGMFSFDLSSQLTLLTGARIECTENKYRSLYEGDDNLNTDEVTGNYVNVLPSLHLTYKPTSKINIRAAYSTGLARPSYYSLVPVEIESDGSGSKVEIKKGNPDLEATTSNNFDLMFERYTNYLGFVSAGVFYKKLSNIISDVTTTSTEDGVVTEVTMPTNRDDASIIGAEFAFNQRLHFIKAPILKDMTIYGNYTYTHSKYEVDGRELPLSSSPENVFNLALMYDNANSGWSFVVSNVFRDALLTAEGDNKYLDEYYGSEYHLDVSIGKKIGEHLTLLLQLNNLTDQHEREFLGDPSKNYSRKLQWEKYNASGMFTVQYKL